ncbi:MAG TPA: hypothetical protein VHY58_00495 [Streptosporangiaceae bacterium]|jgi:hypothetical protein|nr:hypothetical protein [Streptosporangiaceae bacterium]
MARSSSGGLSGQILVPAAHRRDLFGLWRQALGLEEATEIPSGTGMPVYLHARGVRSGVTVRIAATVFDDEEDGR